MADFQQKLDALKGLVGVLNSMDDGETESTHNGSPSTPRNYNPTLLPGRNHSKGKYKNSGKQNIKGLSNQTGFTEGNANGAINFGDLRIASGICTLALGAGDAQRRSTRAQSCPPAPAPSSEDFAYSNAGKQNIKGLTNQTGYVKGNANGVINFGTLTSSANAQRQP